MPVSHVRVRTATGPLRGETGAASGWVTLGAALIQGNSGAVSKLLALPVFCLAVVLARLGSNALVARQKPPMRSLVAVKVLLLVVAVLLPAVSWAGPLGGHS